MELFDLKESEEMTAEWNRMMFGLAVETRKIKKEVVRNKMLDVLLIALYLGYDTNYPFVDQVRLHMEKIKKIFASEFHRKIKFD